MNTPLSWRSPIRTPHATIQIADVRTPLTNAETWRATLTGHVYLLAGTSTDANHPDRITGYVGISERHTSGRPWASLTRWVRSVAALHIRTIGLVTLDHPNPDPDVLRVIECSVIRLLSPRIDLLNTATSAITSTRALAEHAPGWAAYGHRLGTALQEHVLQGRTNRETFPAHTLHETAVRVVLAADSALDTAEVLARVQALGGPTYTGASPGATLRRDLTVRETQGHAGPPRVRTTHLAGRTLYFPAHLDETDALQRYTARTRHPTAA